MQHNEFITSSGQILRRLERDRLKSWLSSNLDLNKLYKKVDGVAETTGARIVYIDQKNTDVVLREFQPGCRRWPITLVFRESPPQISAKEFSSKLKQDQRDSKIIGEILGATISCSAVVLSWIVVIGSGFAIPMSGGASTAVTYLGYAAATASTAQCFNGVVRSGLEAYSPGTKDWLDSETWYVNASLALDAISLAGAGSSLYGAIKAHKVLKASTSKSTLEILKQTSRAERKRITQEIIKLNHPGVSSKAMKVLIAGGKYPQRYSQGQISEALALKMSDAFGASLSALGSAIGGVGKSIAVGIYEQTVDL